MSKYYSSVLIASGRSYKTTLNLYRPQCILYEGLAILTKIFQTTKEGVLSGKTVVE